MGIDDIRSRLKKNKKNLHSLDDVPSEVTDWIPTGVKHLDYIINLGSVGGIPVGKISTIEGLKATGKSYLAVQIAVQAQKKGIYVVYCDSEFAIDPKFLKQMGIKEDLFLYNSVSSVEGFFELVEEVLDAREEGERFLFVWDSVANTPTKDDMKRVGDFDPQSTMALKARIISKAMSKLTVPLGQKESTLLCLNQLKDNITSGPNAYAEKLKNPYVSPGGKTLDFASQLLIWLTNRDSKSSYVLNDSGEIVGTEVKAELKKSRFGTYKRKCVFKLLWGGGEELGIFEQGEWYDLLQEKGAITKRGAKSEIIFLDGEAVQFVTKDWLKTLKGDESFNNRVDELLRHHLIEQHVLSVSERNAGTGKVEDEE